LLLLVISRIILRRKIPNAGVHRGGNMKMIAEYLADAVKFERMAEDAIDPTVKAAFKNQAEAYRKLAVKRANELGVPVPAIPESEKG
jgi:hypothetical protein